MGHPQQTVRSQRVFLGIPQWFTQVASVELLGKGSFIFRQGKHPAFSLPTSPSFFRSARHAFGEISFQLLIVSFVYVWKRTLIWEILPMNMWVCLRMGCNRTISTIKCNFKRDNFDKPSNSGDSYGVITLNPNFRAESLLVISRSQARSSVQARKHKKPLRRGFQAKSDHSAQRNLENHKDCNISKSQTHMYI